MIFFGGIDPGAVPQAIAFVQTGDMSNRRSET
jgi:hypothetical protein